LENNDYKDAFLTEAKEYLSNLNNALVELEKNPGHSQSINEIFRAAHTLKGMSATMGYEPMATLTHHMESVLEPIRSGEKKLSPYLVDALFACLDRLESWVRVLSNQDFLSGEGLEAILETLKKVSAASDQDSEGKSAGSEKPSPGFTLSKEELDVLSQAKMGGFQVLEILMEVDPQSAFKEVRAFMILRAINDQGEIVKASPAPEAIEKGQFESQFKLLVITDQKPETIREILMKISEVQAAQIENWNPETSGPGPGAPSRSLSSVADPVPDEKSFVLPTVRVHTTKLDKLMSLVQELVIAKIRFEQVVASNDVKDLTDPLSQLNHITDELQDEITKVRLMPVKQIFDRFPRMVRDLAKSLGKDVDLEMSGVEVELDRTVIEEMGEPLVHLLRNAVDHGIENPNDRERDGKESYGVIRLEAKRERSFVIISVADDGRGIDPDVIKNKAVSKGLISREEAQRLNDEEAVRLIALPGFSTIEEASEISGRGVGVDVAKTKVESMGGTFRIQSRKGQGTTFSLRFPLTLAIIKALLIRNGEERFAVPVVGIVETLDITPLDKKYIQQQEALLLRGEVIPLYYLTELLEMPEAYSHASRSVETVLIAEVGDSRVGIIVDEVLGQQEVAIKPLDRVLKGIRGFAGATILGTGKIALILDISSLIEDLKEKRNQLEHLKRFKKGNHVAQSR
jgi:two-component system, chemotaxis family, sensor kinase CheA